MNINPCFKLHDLNGHPHTKCIENDPEYIPNYKCPHLENGGTFDNCPNGRLSEFYNSDNIYTQDILDEDDDNKDHCTSCHKYKDIYGFCGENGDPFCEDCWQSHVDECEKCQWECGELPEDYLKKNKENKND